MRLIKSEGEIDMRQTHKTEETRETTDPEATEVKRSLFNLPETGLDREKRHQILARLLEYETRQKNHFLGYQVNQGLHFQEDLKQYLDFHVNNIGDPFVQGNFTVNSKFVEQAVLDYYARLWKAQVPHNPENGDSYWGYVLSMGSSEGNIYGLWNARDYLAGKALIVDPDTGAAPLDGSSSSGKDHLIYQQPITLPANQNAYTPIAFFSADTHYSIVKAMRVLAIQTFYEVGTRLYPNDCPLGKGKPWPAEVPSKDGPLGPGSIDLQALTELVKFFAVRGHPILVSFNYGTTFKGAYDDVEKAGELLMPIFKDCGLDQREVKYGKDKQGKDVCDIRTGYWFHVDGALGAGYMPFIEKAYEAGKIKERGPNFDFRLPMVHSLVMSGHKWAGAPWPCGIYMTKVKMQIKPPARAEYIGSPDTTFAGSRNGLSPIILWNFLATHSYEKQIEMALHAEERCEYARKKLEELGQRLKKDLWVQRSPLALTVRFKAAHPDIIKKYSLSGETLAGRHYSHIFIMPGVDEKRIDALINDLAQQDGIPDQEHKAEKAVTTDVLAEIASPLVAVPMAGRGFK
jgi:histidine decarboxylase